MPIFRLSQAHVFPPVHLAEDEGLLAVGGDLDPERVLLGYAQGIFPWFSEPPILWWAPDPRMVLRPAEAHIPRSVRKECRRATYRVTLDQAFAQVIDHCATVPREGQDGTWITPDMRECYVELHRRGFAHSVEAWQGDALVGGAYGVSLGRAFFGESMFALRPNASKVAFATLLEQLTVWGFELIDCQVHTEHLARFGAKEVPGAEFYPALSAALAAPTRLGPWAFGRPASGQD